MTPAEALIAELDALEAEIGELVIKLARCPMPSTQRAAVLLAELWPEVRSWREDGAQMRLSFDVEGAA